MNKTVLELKPIDKIQLLLCGPKELTREEQIQKIFRAARKLSGSIANYKSIHSLK